MNRLLFFIGFAITLLFVVGARAEAPNAETEAVTIPLEQIWGYHLPGTRDIAEIPLPKARNPEQLIFERTQYVEQIRRALTTKQTTQNALPGFIFPRESDFYTLRAVSSQLSVDSQGESKGHPYGNSFPTSDDLTLVFFSHAASYRVRLNKVELNGADIKVSYQFEPRSTAEVGIHFALIPLGKLPAREYRVQYEQIPLDQKYLDAGFEAVEDASTIVCRSFSFAVFEPPSTDDAKPADGATLIPLDQIWALNMPGTREVRDIDAAAFESLGVKNSPTIDEIKLSLVRRRRDENAGQAFVVIGAPADAVQYAHAVLVKGKKPARILPPNVPLNLVFFSKMTGRYVHISSVERLNETLTVKYRFVSHPTMETTTHFALIPLGTLAEGKYDIKIVQLPATDTAGGVPRPIANPEQIVCQESSFAVQKEE